MFSVGFPIRKMYVIQEKEFRCGGCGKEAQIFQDEGDYCVHCWQAITEPVIT
jgi:hypothetical protein